VKRVAILQSNYIPWKGYFDLIDRVDEFILYDDRQYTRRDWRNHNLIKTPAGPRWLTIPVEVKGRYHQRIDETVVSDPAWAAGHWSAIRSSYAKSACFGYALEHLAPLYQTAETRLSRINHSFLVAICRLLGITSRISWSTDSPVEGDRTERLVAICRAAGASA